MNGHLRRKSKVLELARYPALDNGRVVVWVLQCVDQALANLFDPHWVLANRAAFAFEHDVGVEGELAGGGENPRVMDVQVELGHGCHGHGKEVVLILGVDEDLRATFKLALGGFLDQY